MGAIFSLMQKYFRQTGWQAVRVDQRSVLRLRYLGTNHDWTCYAQERAETGQFLFYVIYPEFISSERLKAATELVTRANYGLVVGNFELDLVDGELRYKACLDLAGEDPSLGLIHRMVSACVGTMELYSTAIEKVLQGRLSPTEALAETEKS